MEKEKSVILPAGLAHTFSHYSLRERCILSLAPLISNYKSETSRTPIIPPAGHPYFPLVSRLNEEIRVDISLSLLCLFFFFRFVFVCFTHIFLLLLTFVVPFLRFSTVLRWHLFPRVICDGYPAMEM